MTEEVGASGGLMSDLASSESGHVVQFYEQSTYLIDRVAAFIAPGLGAGEAAIVIATPPHREMIGVQLGARGIDVAQARSQGSYVDLDAADTMAKFMIDGRPDRARFIRVIGDMITQARPKAQFPIVRAFGEMVALLWAQGRQEAAIDVEELWNQLLGHHPFSLMCGYPIEGLGDPDSPTVRQMMASHTKAHPWEGRG
jgi:DcmR-like sensory protein